MLNEETKTIVNPIEIEEGTFFVPLVQEDEIEREIIERRPAHGRVRWFSRSLGYGFVWEAGRNEEIFVHQTSIQTPGIKNLRPGQRVLFELCKTSKGTNIAINVIPIQENPDALARYRSKHPEESH